jgi:uncharacterized membrane protein
MDLVGQPRPGFVNFIGFLTFVAAIEKGKVSTAIAMSSLYPVIAIVLSVLLRVLTPAKKRAPL